MILFYFINENFIIYFLLIKSISYLYFDDQLLLYGFSQFYYLYIFYCLLDNFFINNNFFLF